MLGTPEFIPAKGRRSYAEMVGDAYAGSTYAQYGTAPAGWGRMHEAVGIRFRHFSRPILASVYIQDSFFFFEETNPIVVVRGLKAQGARGWITMQEG